jgi:hypothetical protein
MQSQSMPHKPTPLLLVTWVILLLSVALPAAAERPGWNEPPQAPGYDRDGLLKINAGYFNMAAATGGDFYFWAPGEFAASAGLLDVPVASDPVVLAYRSGDGDFAQSLEIPVDAALTRLSLFVGAQRLDEVRLFRPDGRSVEANPAGVAVQTYKHMRIATVEDPETGTWRVEARGAGSYSIAARYQSERKKLSERDLEAIDLIGFTFVELGGRPGHEGLFPIDKPVGAGEEELLRVTLSGGIREPSVEMVSAAGDLLGACRLDMSTEEVAADEFVGVCRIPEQPFRVRVRGRDGEGKLFQRISAALISPLL